MYLCLRSFRPFNWHTALDESSKPCLGTVYTDDTESGPNVMTPTPRLVFLEPCFESSL